MYSIGLDAHQGRHVLCILDHHGKRIKEAVVRGGGAELVAFLRRLGRPFAICYEASCSYGYLYDLLSGVARRVLVAHPGQLRLIFRSKRKHDRVDARKLATLLFLDQVPTVHVPAGEVRSWRRLIEFRRRLVDKRTQAKNGLRALLRAHGVVGPYRKALWTRKGRAWLAQLEWPERFTALQRDLLLDEVEHADARLKTVEGALNALARRHPGVQLLRTIPGVGPRTAEALVAYLDQVDRFARARQVGAYLGLVPCQDQSHPLNRLGHITREGPPTVRKFLTEAAWRAIQLSPWVRAFFERIQQNDPDRKKIALIATAHYLARVAWAMLRTGETWRHDPRPVEPQPGPAGERAVRQRARRRGPVAA